MTESPTKAQFQELERRVVDSFPDDVRTLSCCVVASALLHNLLIAQGVPEAEVVSGFAVVVKDKTYFPHVWVRVGQEKYDPGTAIFCRNTGLPTSGLVLTVQEPSSARRVVPPQADALLQSLQRYQKEPRKFWETAPTSLKLRRRLLLRKAADAGAT